MKCTPRLWQRLILAFAVVGLGVAAQASRVCAQEAAPASSARPATAAPAAPAAQPAAQLPAPADRGGAWPFLQSCLCGPRIGLEANEGNPATGIEYLNFFIPIIVPIQALGTNGVPGCCASLCIGPRVGMQLHERRIRTLEWFRVVPILNVYAAIVNGFEAGEGRTMGEIVEAEGMAR